MGVVPGKVEPLVGRVFIMKPVKITWMDSRGVTTSWEFLDELEPLVPSKITSVGFLLEETEEYKTIVQSVSENQVVGRMTIPLSCIKEVACLD
jgi:uncharacterized protein YktA (UPF0223 family)